MVQEAGGKVVDGNGKTLLFNRQEARHHGVVAANGQLADRLQDLWIKAISGGADARYA
jgi:fructose-1,6-bisphosphatase/inositol monophosphatase family enzyme